MVGSKKTCCVPKCGKSRVDKVILHTFPDPEKEKERFIAWMDAVGSSISQLDHQYIYKNRTICHEHFEEKFLTWSRRLSPTAVPTLCTPGFQVGRVVMGDITNVDVATTTIMPKATSHAIDSAVPSTSAGFQVGQVVMGDITDVNIATTNIMPKASSHAIDSAVPSTSAGNKFADEKALRKMLKSMTKKKDSYSNRLKKALNLSENITFQKTLQKFKSIAALFLTMQFREINKNKMGRRFTEQEKIMALSLYKMGPRCYRFMSKAFVLPSPLTLNRLIGRANLRAGINGKLFNVMQRKIKNLKSDDKLCVLLFDEMAISPHFDYNQRKDDICGFVHNGKEKVPKMADHALVFMIRGVLRNYKQPVAYTFCSGSTKKDELARLIKEVIRKLHSVGLRVLATVCDQGASNVSCINTLIEQTKAKYLRRNEEHRRNTFEVDDSEIIPLYDPPHLIKGIRNNLLNKNLKCTIDGVPKLAKWEHVKLLHQENPSYGGIRLLKNLTEDHINPEKCKMKVKFATQIFSQKVGSTMGYLADKNILPVECKQTADVLLFFDELFDSCNGSYENSKKRSGKILLRALTPTSPHNAFWTKAKIILRSMKFISKGNEINIPSVTNWLHTIDNIQYLRDILFNKYEIKSIWIRHFNQDPLENFFGSIRSHGCRNVSPTPAGFEAAFASVLMTNLTGTHSPGSNCEEDSCSLMFKSMKPLFRKNPIVNTSLDIDLNYMTEDIFVDFERKREHPVIIAQLDYVTGYLLKKTTTKVFKNCQSCTRIFYDKNKYSKYLNAREFNKKQRNLAYASNNLVNMFSRMQDIIIWVLKTQSHTENIKNFCKTILYVEIDTRFITCEVHKNNVIEFMFNLTCNFFIFNWCNDINNILKGKRTQLADDADGIKRIALDYAKKRRKM